MKCPYCGADDTKVIDSRPAEENNAIREDVSARNATSVLQHMKK